MVRVAFAAEVPSAAEVVGAWHWAEWGPSDEGETKSDWVARLRSWCRTSSLPVLLVAVDDDHDLVGSVSLIESDMPHHADWADVGPWLSGLYVVPERRESGVGRALVAACEEHARRCGIETLLLYTSAAQRLYEDLGWQVLETVLYGSDAAVVMTKDLRAC